MRSTATWVALLAALLLFFGGPSPAAPKGKKMKSCANAAATGRDGDGLSDCRESKQLGTSPDHEDTDDDGLGDGDEVMNHCDPNDSDSDHDGVGDGDDDTPGIPKQKLEAFLDALTCPQVG